MKSLTLTVLLLVATTGVAQQGDGAARRNAAHPQPLSAQELSENAANVLKRVAQSMGRYARDISEIPLNVESTVYRFDTSGNEKHRKTSLHSMQFVKRSYAEGKVSRRLEARKPGLRRVSVDELNADSATALLALLFDSEEVSASNTYHLALHTLSKRLEVKIVDGLPCEGFDPTIVHDQRPFCGKTNLLLDSTTLSPLSASFEAGGFPSTFGKIRYLSFKFTEEFQKVLLEGSEEPFLLPAKVVVTYESDRGRTVIESTYSVESKTIRALLGTQALGARLMRKLDWKRCNT